MQDLFNKQLWEKYITQDDWYLKLGNEFKRIEQEIKDLPSSEREPITNEFYDFIEKRLQDGAIHLATDGPNWDSDRTTVDTVVIHHSSRAKGLTTNRLNAMHLLRLYVPYFINPHDEDILIKGKAVWSGHFNNGNQVFYGYHKLIKQNGELINLLEDKYIGWHAGNANINARSVGICLDDDLENKTPSESMSVSLVDTIKQYYPDIKKTRIFGHCEINSNTVCPGNNYIDGWKNNILKNL